MLIVSLSAEQEKPKFDFGKPMEMIAFSEAHTHRRYDIYGLILVPRRHKKQL